MSITQVSFNFGDQELEVIPAKKKRKKTKGSPFISKIVPKFRLEMVMESETEYGLITGTEKAQETFLNFGLHKNAEEVLALITLDTQNNITGYFEVSRGTLDMSLVSPREIFKRAILSNARSIILGHNHPGGSLKPSRDDVGITKKIKEAGKLLGINLHDHIIVTPEGKTVSMAEKGLF